MLEAVLSLLLATTLLLGSPGPAPLALAATGATFGIKNGMPFLIGILLGLCVVIIGTAAGMAALLATMPATRTGVQLLGALYILYVAYKIATAPILNAQDTDITAPSALDGFMLNLLNPKAYAAFLAIFTQFVLPFTDPFIGLIATAFTCFLVAIMVDIIWLCLGGVLRPVFETPRAARAMRVTFALLMIVAVAIALMTSSG